MSAPRLHMVLHKREKAEEEEKEGENRRGMEEGEKEGEEEEENEEEDMNFHIMVKVVYISVTLGIPTNKFQILLQSVHHIGCL